MLAQMEKAEEIQVFKTDRQDGNARKNHRLRRRKKVKRRQRYRRVDTEKLCSEV